MLPKKLTSSDQKTHKDEKRFLGILAIEKADVVGVIRRCIKKRLTLGHFIYALMSPMAENSTSVVELQSMWTDRKTL